MYVGVLEREKDLRAETHPLYWLSTEEDLFDLEKFAGEGNIGHMVQQVVCYGDGACELEEKAY